MTFKREITVSDIIALLALIISGCAYYEVIQSQKGFIIQGGGQPSETLMTVNNKLLNIISYPIEFHNSGEKAVVLKHLSPIDNSSQDILFSSNTKILEKNKIKFKVYLSSFRIRSISDYIEVTNKGTFKTSYSHINDLIKPNDLYKFYYIIVIEDYLQYKEYSDLNILHHFNAIFDNEQKIRIASSLKLLSRN